MQEKKKFPKPLSVKKILGPSFIILALGLGSGEVILWPYLTSNYGLGIAWGAVLGITFQFFINMEIERYALVKGESVFVGIAGIFKWSTYWFIISTFIGFALPGIIAASAKVLSFVIGVEDFRWIAVLMLCIVGMILSVGETVYGTVEKITKNVIIIAVPLIFILTMRLSSNADWSLLLEGIVGRGDGFWFLPSGISLAAFLAAFAYSGAGGNLNLSQSIYIKEKGYGMGKYSQRISGFFKSKGTQKIRLAGEDFDVNNEENISNYKAWWRTINIEHFIVFWFVGLFSILLLMLLAFTTTYGLEGNVEGIGFLINQGEIIGTSLGAGFGILFLCIISILLFQTQLGVMDSTSRIMAENFAIAMLDKNSSDTINLPRIYYVFVWLQVVFGTILFLCDISEPKSLIILGAVINAFAMCVHIGLVTFLNHRKLPKIFRPNIFRKIIIGIIFIFFGLFTILVLLDRLGIFQINI